MSRLFSTLQLGIEHWIPFPSSARAIYVNSGIGTTYRGLQYLKCQLTGANGGARLSFITRGRAGLGTRRSRNKAYPVVEQKWA